MYKADAASTSYSPLEQVNTTNVTQLKEAWTYQFDDAKEGVRGGSQCNPIVIDDVMYIASLQRTIFALDASTGKKIWSFDPFYGARGGGSFRALPIGKMAPIKEYCSRLATTCLRLMQPQENPSHHSAEPEK
jgi:quinoprotein glucose dehydrogenase